MHASLGDIDEAYRWLEIAVQEKASGLSLLRVHPRLDPIRSDARYWPLVRRVGLDDGAMVDRYSAFRVIAGSRAPAVPLPSTTVLSPHEGVASGRIVLLKMLSRRKPTQIAATSEQRASRSAVSS